MSVEAVRAAEESRIACLLGGDVHTFADLCDDRLVYTHSVGRRDDKGSMLQALRSGTVRYVSIEHDLEDIHVVGDAACTFGRMLAEIDVRGGTRLLDTLTTAVWTRGSGRWRLIAFHTTART